MSGARRPATLTRVGVVGFLLVGMSAVLSVNVFSVVTNDGLVYLEHSRNLGGLGLVTLGYRQVGYPLFLSTVRQFAELVGAEPLLSVAVMQRTILLAGLGFAWWAWRWWALPLFVFLLAPSTVAYTNFILTESLALPIALCLAVPVYLCITWDATRTDGQRLVILTALVAAGAFALYTVKFTNIGFAVLPALLVGAAWRTTSRNRVAIVFICFVLAMAGFTLAMGAENQRELGTFRPSVQVNGADYFYAWSYVFNLHPENRNDQALARFYDDGHVYDFIRESAESAGYPEIVGVRREEVREMFDAAGISQWGSRVESAFFALAGGRQHDIQSRVDRVTSSEHDNVYEAVYQNRVAIGEGPRVFARRYNDGATPEVVITDAVAKKLPLPPNRKSAALLLVLAGVIAVVGVFNDRPARFLALSASIPLLLHAVGFGWIWADNFRFMLPSVVLTLGLSTGLARHLYWRRRSNATPASS